MNGWDRSYPNGGIFDTASSAWRPLPDRRSDRPPVDLLASDQAVVDSAGRRVFDLAAAEWTELPPVLHSPDYTRRNIVVADLDIVTFGGEQWTEADPDGSLLHDAWFWKTATS